MFSMYDDFFRAAQVRTRNARIIRTPLVENKGDLFRHEIGRGGGDAPENGPDHFQLPGW
jgi:hypothetical protein